MEEKNLTQVEQTALLQKWLHMLFWVKMVTLVGTCLAPVTILSPVIPWVNRLISAGLIVVLFQLAGVNENYKKSSLYYAIALVGGLVGALMDINLLTLAGSICGIIAQYRELEAHSEVTKPLDEKLSGKWHSLFYWQLGVGAVTGFLPAAAVVVAVGAGVETSTIVFVVALFIAAVSAAFTLVYLRYLKKMQALVV